MAQTSLRPSFDHILKLPLFVILMGMGAISMLVPAIYGWFAGEYYESRVFFYGAILFGFLTAFLGLATAGLPRSSRPYRHLLALLGLFVLLPLMMAVPFHQAVRTTSFLNAYMEMVSDLTTTGATLFDDPGRLANTVHLWRALVGWLGGAFIWVGAIAILAPMSLGGFEVRTRFGARFDTSRDVDGRLGAGLSQITRVADLSERIRTYGVKLFPVYTGLTLALWVGLTLTGENPFVALCHAMSTLATSGISPVDGIGGAGIGGEAMIAVFFVFAISRLTFSTDMQADDLRGLLGDAEIRMALAIVTIVPLFLFLRHWLGALDVDEEMNLKLGLTSLWGGVFTTLSFLTTTGFESEAWAASQDWSGLHTPGLILMGLALIGGGVATTAGGAKLLRVYALFLHGQRELERLVHPSSIGGGGADARHMRGRGAYLAWIFFMLMTLTLSLIAMALSLTGQDFENALILTVSALTTTGPLANVAGAEPISYADLSDPAKLIMVVAMVLGRLETLAIIALFNPESWRR